MNHIYIWAAIGAPWVQAPIQVQTPIVVPPQVYIVERIEVRQPPRNQQRVYQQPIYPQQEYYQPPRLVPQQTPYGWVYRQE